MKLKSKKSSLIRFLKNRQIAIIGYGSQGQAQALNLSNSGILPLIGLRTKSKSRRKANQDGFDAVTPIKAISQADIISILIPDHRHKEFFESLPSSNILKGKALIFAHGMSVAFGLIKPPYACDVMLVAPHGPGVRIRELYRQGKAFTAFWAVEQNYSGDAAKIAKAYSTAIGCPSTLLFESSFRDEAVGDIFGEQAVLCGGLVGLIQTGFQTLVNKGFSTENAYLECIYQLDLIIDLIKKYGPAEMFKKISITAAVGSLRSKNILFDKEMIRKMEKLYHEIDSGRFAEYLMKQNKFGMKDFQNELKAFKKSRLQTTHDSLSRRLGL